MKTWRERVDDLLKKGISYDNARDRALENYENSIYDMRCRIDKRIKTIIESGNGIFYTLTISENYNNPEDYDRIEKKAKKWAKDHFDVFLGNRDYGEQSNRIHWHICAIGKEELPKQDSWKYGNVNWIRFYNEKHKKIRNYLIKMSRHATKSTASHLFRSQKQV